MPVCAPHAKRKKLSAEYEEASLALWKKKTHGVTSYTWDGNTLVITGTRGREIFSREIVEAVIFANFIPN